MIILDLGSDLNSKIFAELVKLMGMKRTFSFADRAYYQGSHQTFAYSGIKSAMFSVNFFSYPVSNTSYKISETSYTLFELTFGNQDVVYTDLFKGATAFTPEYKL